MANQHEEAVAEILNKDVTRDQVAAARQFIAGFMFTTSSLLAIEVALREQYAAFADDGIETVEGAPLADLVSTIVRKAAELEAEEL